MNISELLKNFIEPTIKQMVDKPEVVTVNTSATTKSIIIQIKTDQEDCGKIIGKRGKTIDALKVISLAIKKTNFPEDNRRLTLEIIEDEDSPFRFKKN